jgi:hypothetical protein
MTIELLKRNNFFDFMQVSTDDLRAEQEFHLDNTASLANTVAGSGIILDFPTEPIIFDSDSLDSFQQGLVALNTFDGQGLLSEPYLCTDTVGGNQLAVSLSDARVEGVLKTSVLILGKTFDDSLIYEMIELNDNTSKVTRNHFIEVVNILTQNLRGNGNTSVDGYGCFNVGGRLVLTEASSFRLDRGCIAAEQIAEPDLRLTYFKTSETANSLHEELISALGPSNDIDDLNVNTTTATTREFTQGADTAFMLAQKFKMRGNNIQKVSLALGLSSGSSWSGSLEIGIRPLLDTASVCTDYLPDTEIAFDPDVNTLETIILTEADLLNQGVVLSSDYQIVDVIFSGTKLGNPILSGLVDGQYYAITLRRLGSTATGTIVTPEARNSDADLRLSVFDTGVWTDVSDKSLWFQVWTAGAFAASGAAYDTGRLIAEPKTELNDNAVTVQRFADNIPLVNTSEDAENYIILQSALEYSDIIAHPRTGDRQATRQSDVALISALEQDNVSELFDSGLKPLILGRMIDKNPKNNPQITGTLDYPALAQGNIIDIINPGSDLLVQNVIGSTIIPNTLQPTKKYRIIGQDIITDIYGDLDGDGIISIDDAARLIELDGYAPNLNQGTVSPTIQLQAVLAGSVSIAELLRADLSNDGYVTSAADGYEITEYLNNGTGFTAGSSFTRVRLTVEPLFNQFSKLTVDAESTLTIHAEDSSLVNNTSFSSLTFQIDFIPTWDCDSIEVTDLRRYTTTTFIDFDITDLEASPENGGQNSTFIPGDLYLTGGVKNLDGSVHSLDFEKNIIELELPTGDTVGEINIFSSLVLGKMRFSDGTYVSSSAIADNQVRFEVAISSISKDVDGYDYNDGYFVADEIVGTYIDHNTGLLRLHCKNIKENSTLPQLRTRLLITVNLKKAGFKDAVTKILSSQIADLLV